MTMEKFHYEADVLAEDGTTETVTITIPHLRNVPVGLFRKVAGMDELSASFAIFEGLTDEATMADIDRLGLGDFHELQVEWEKASKISLGESVASSTS